MPNNFASTDEICEGSEGSRKRKSLGQQILVWDRFNTTVWLLIVTSFVVWCFAYFAAYRPEDETAHVGHDMDHSTGHDVDHGTDHGMH